MCSGGGESEQDVIANANGTLSMSQFYVDGSLCMELQH